jgi:hypothetical protein
MHLVVDARVSLLDLEGAVVSPGSVPGVNTQPVVFSLLVTPSDHLDGVTSQGVSRGVLVDTALVGQEIFVDSEGGSSSTVREDILLDLVNRHQTVAGGSHVLILGVVNAGVGGARASTLRLDLGDVTALGEGGSRLVVVAFTHGVIVAQFAVTEVSSRNYTLFGEPFPGGSNLTSIASHGLALEEVAAASGIGDRELVGESTISLNAETIVVSFSGSMGPARTAVRLVTDVVNDRSALGPVGSSIKDLRGRQGTIGGEVSRFNTFNSPLGVDDSSHECLDFLKRDVGELAVDTGSPGGCLVVVHDVDVALEEKRSLFFEHLHDIGLVALAHV